MATAANAAQVPVPKVLKFDPQRPPMTALVAAKALNFKVAAEAVPLPLLVFSYGHQLFGSHTPAKAIAIGTPLYPGPESIEHGLVDQWMEQATLIRADLDFTGVASRLAEQLKLNVYLVGHNFTLADITIWSVLRTMPSRDAFLAHSPHIQRWFSFISAQAPIVQTLSALERQVETIKAAVAAGATKKASREGPADIELPGAVMGKVVTRFPPEPSGYLHVGHAKAAMTNDFFAKKYQGTMIVRFDDTNPSKEKAEFEQSIMEDLRLLDVTWTRVTHTSDYFEPLMAECVKMIKAGKAYVDDTPVEQLREWRGAGIESPRRSLPPEDHLKLWDEMVKGTELGQKCCVRAKIDMQEKNKCMRDPIMYRVNLLPHHITKNKFLVYPTYDFACPYVDAIEGVTHAMRSSEYKDREPQYYWFIQAMGLRKPEIYAFARLNFEYTVLSKRKLNWFVNTGRVTGWDDPRFPTVRGVRRRGLTVEAMREFILLQGASKRTTNQTWQKVWALNKKHIDPIVPRYTAIAEADAVRVTLLGAAVPGTVVYQTRPLHKKNPDLGTKPVAYGPVVLMEQDDLALLSSGEEITLMDWGNAIVTAMEKNASGKITAASMTLNLTGDYRKTKHKMTWLCADVPLPRVKVARFHDLITKPALDEDDVFEDYVNQNTIEESYLIGEPNLRSVSADALLQIERKGFYRCDVACAGSDAADKPITLFYIPDGKKES